MNSAWHPLFERARALGRPLVLGHRGASAHVTENTLESFAAARDAGADGVEFDVHLCASGEVVIFHDAQLSRLAGRGERIASMPWSELERVVIGRDKRIPTLEQFFGEFTDPAFVVNIEIKSLRLGRAAELVDRVLASVVEHRGHALESVLISSFDPFVIGRVRRYAPDVATGYLFHGDEPLVLRRAWRTPPLRPHALHPDYHLLSAACMERWRAGNFAIATWTVDHPSHLQRAAALGVQVVISNDPGHALGVVGA